MSLAITSSCVKAEQKRLSAIERPAIAETAASRNVQAVAQAALSACPYREVQKVTCLVSDGVLILTGTVSTFYLKQVAQTILMNIEGVNHIANALTVCPLQLSVTNSHL